MSVRSQGILLYQPGEGEPRLKLVHPGGPFRAGKDDSACSIPKCLPEREINRESSPAVNSGSRDTPGYSAVWSTLD
ncbi:MAG: hypothetical protein R3308_11220 [Thiohalobacterales bacterium]|nr:hypothetical protein [Thiohalobacterales bacterium]